MGCWNGTCALTSLPITSGTEIYIFPVVETMGEPSYCYTCALWTPMSLSFQGTYNDYGAAEDCHGVALPFIIDTIKQRLVEVDVGENEYHDIAVVREGFDLDAFFESTHEQRLKVKNPMAGYEGHPKYLDMNFAMVRKDVIDRLWTDYKFNMWKPKNWKETSEFETDQYYIKNISYTKMFDTIPAFIKRHMEDVNIDSGEVYSSIKDSNPELYQKLIKIHFEDNTFMRDHDSVVGSIFERIFSGNGYNGKVRFGESSAQSYIIDTYPKNPEMVYDLMKAYLISSLVDTIMNKNRGIWYPTMHQGSQSESLNTYRLMNKISSDLINEREKYFDDE